MRFRGLFPVVLCLFSACLFATEIRLGVSNATQGPAFRLGVDLNTGAELYFNSRQFKQLLPDVSVKLVKYNDGYEPDNALYNTKELLKQDVLALFNYVGTPTSKAVMATVNSHGIPYITPFTGADFLREQTATNVFNFRASYEQEVEAQMAYLVNNLNLKKIGILIQADEFGLALERYHIKAFREYNLTPAVVTRYKRNTLDVARVAKKMANAKVEAVLFVGTYHPLNEVIRIMAFQRQEPVFASVSFISSQVLFDLIPKSSKVIITEVVPDPLICQLPLCRLFVEEATAAKVSNINRVHFEGYLNAMYFSLAASQCRTNIDRHCLMKSLEDSQFSWGDKVLTFSKQLRQMNNSIYLNLKNLPI